MSESDSLPFSRRRFLRALAVSAAPAAFLVQARTLCAEGNGLALAPTPAAGEPLKLTQEETAGPFFRPDSPAKSNFRESGVGGTPVTLTGFVVDFHGNAISGALLDFWHADDRGKYDLKGYRCRGHQFARADGQYMLETILPGLYPGRTRHYHVRLQAAHGPILSTQLYFPGEPRNETDWLFKPELLLKIRKSPEGSVATFNFVLETTTSRSG
jgi:protocatechuate 3,4-dioxygenase beta subunit